MNNVIGSIKSADDFLELNILEKCSTIINDNNIPQDVAHSIISTAVFETEEFSRPMWRFYNDMREKHKNIFDIISPEIFLNIVRHLKKIANQKIERRNVGVNIIICSQEGRSNRIGASYPVQFQPYVDPSDIKDIRAFFIDESNNLQRIYKCIDSSNAFFAYTYNKEQNSLKFDEIKTFNGRSMKDICREHDIGFQLSGGKGLIRIYNGCKKIVDYYLSEITGDWVARFDSDIAEILNGFKMFNEADAKILTDLATEISCLGYGAMLIITQSPQNFGHSSAPCEISDEELEEATSNKTVYNYTSYDGAVIIKCGEDSHSNERLKICNFGVLINPKASIDTDDDYDVLLHYTNSGSRHEKAVRYAYDNPNDCVIVISENRTISILHGNSPIYWRDNVNPTKLINYVRKEN